MIVIGAHFTPSRNHVQKDVVKIIVAFILIEDVLGSILLQTMTRPAII